MRVRLTECECECVRVCVECKEREGTTSRMP